MLLMVFGLLLVLMRPNWNFLFFFAGCIAALWAVQVILGAIEFHAEYPVPQILFSGTIMIVVRVGVFLAIGALIVKLRGGKAEEKGPSAQEIDAELAKMRAEKAAREPRPVIEQWTDPP
ncbi:MAG: hypothetical protein IV086_07775 [Hyphomonadaceae bacterium]|nr:MAG: hypothetical protein FD160_3877 [Caulobacteraceae bacterium]MBT9445578.1 hypothetical protein [Hyphomonadaceae bacterium]TPW01930.1 MAG: hypothetical protein FD124_3562 [Alphaproteobacteria bacterium]